MVTTTVPGDLGGAIAFAATEDISKARRIDVTVDRAFDLGPGGERTSRPDLVGVRQVATNRKGSLSGETGEKVVLVCTEGGTFDALDLIGRLSTWADDWAAFDATGRPPAGVAGG